jgi:hypothetical protein
MSGGSLDYAEYKINDIADMVASRAKTPLHRAFVKHLRDVAKAAHDLEWVFSCDYGEGDEVEALRKVLNKKMELDVAREQAEIALKDLQDVLKAQ